jgi:hypothetical protein
MTLKTSLVVGLAAAALVVGVQTASAAPTSNASDGTSLVRPDFGQNFLYPGGYPQSGHGYLGKAPASASPVQPDFGQSLLYPGGYPQSGHGYLGNPPASASAVGSDSEIGWPQLLGVGFAVGMAVLLGLILTVRIGRSHPVAH